MADAGKRNSAASKSTAGAKSSGGDSLDALSKLGKAIGARVTLTTAAPHAKTYEGTLFTACPVLHIVAINTRAPPPNPASNAAAQPGDYHIIPFSRIAEWKIISLPQSGDGSFASALPAIGPVDTKQLQKQEATRIRQLKEEEQDRGKGVSREGQAIYDRFKWLNQPVRWHQTAIIVHEYVIIMPPYRPEDCRAEKGKDKELGRVKLMLEGERAKLKKEQEKERGSGVATPTVPRKGG